jgi:hypothetical protein
MPCRHTEDKKPVPAPAVYLLSEGHAYIINNTLEEKRDDKPLGKSVSTENQ